jgi:hypothetical protein
MITTTTTTWFGSAQKTRGREEKGPPGDTSVPRERENATHPDQRRSAYGHRGSKLAHDGMTRGES